jgi:peptide/nickel transport system permease protein
VIQASVRRVMTLVATLVLVIIMSFLLQVATPGNPAQIIAGPFGTKEEIAQITKQLGLDRPVIDQFGTYVAHVFSGNLGASALTGQNVTSTIAGALPATASVILVAIVLSLVLSFLGGTAAALRANTWLDRTISTLAAAGLAVPAFVVGLVLVVLFAVEQEWLPASGYVSPASGFWPWLSHLIMPGIALSLASSAELARYVRSSFIDVLDQDYILAANAAGMPRAVILGKRVLKNSAAPIITVFGLQVGRLLSGAVVVEQVFAVPGFGSLAFNSALQRDLPTVQGVILTSAVFVIVINFATDMLYPVFNPKLRG